MQLANREPDPVGKVVAELCVQRQVRARLRGLDVLEGQQSGLLVPPEAARRSEPRGLGGADRLLKRERASEPEAGVLSCATELLDDDRLAQAGGARPGVVAARE
jgi:hypothetical protein